MTGLLESAAGKLSFVWTHDRSVRSFNRSRRSPARLAIQRHRKVRSCCQGTLEYALLLVRFGLWRGTERQTGLPRIPGSSANDSRLRSNPHDPEGASSMGDRRSEERRVGEEGRSRWSPYH